MVSSNSIDIELEGVPSWSHLGQSSASEGDDNYLLAFYCCDKHHDQRQLGKRGLFDLEISVHHCEKPRQEPRGRNQSRDHGRMLLTGFPSWLAQPVFLQVQGYLPRDVAQSH